MHYPGAPRREWLALGLPPPIVDVHTGPRTHVGNGSPYSNGQGMFLRVFVHLIEKYVILNYS